MNPQPQQTPDNRTLQWFHMQEYFSRVLFTEHLYHSRHWDVFYCFSLGLKPEAVFFFLKTVLAGSSGLDGNTWIWCSTWYFQRIRVAVLRVHSIYMYLMAYRFSKKWGASWKGLRLKKQKKVLESAMARRLLHIWQNLWSNYRHSDSFSAVMVHFVLLWYSYKFTIMAGQTVGVRSIESFFISLPPTRFCSCGWYCWYSQNRIKDRPYLVRLFVLFYSYHSKKGNRGKRRRKTIGTHDQIRKKKKKLKDENFSVSLCLHCQDSQSWLESSIPSTIYLNYHSIDQICLEGKKMFLGRANKNGYVQPNQKEKKNRCEKFTASESKIATNRVFSTLSLPTKHQHVDYQVVKKTQNFWHTISSEHLWWRKEYWTCHVDRTSISVACN